MFQVASGYALAKYHNKIPVISSETVDKLREVFEFNISISLDQKFLVEEKPKSLGVNKAKGMNF